ncbi:hypothetical protein ACEWY4_017318 [Coilia grayii]|uniref:NACHT, LRR and PYD domains-containing protein 12-like n=1 Tax=Coilia grayii TaxID=363190 RepID=A0ABD1JHK0_9TELE
MEVQWRGRDTSQDPIDCNDIFKSPNESEEIRRVMTKGIAGVGKSVAVQKFTLDWINGKANKDVNFIFVLPFRKLNLLMKDTVSLYGLLLKFYPELKKGCPVEFLKEAKIIFIFDGLDESKFCLNFEGSLISDIEEQSTVDVLIANLVKGDLLNSALIWVTSRPAAAHQITPEHIDRWTEIQGFTDEQKEQYFRNKIQSLDHDQTLADKVLKQIKASRNLYIMCRIPLFCWFLATVLLDMCVKGELEIPKTLTEIYTHFLLIQLKRKEKKSEACKKEAVWEVLESNRDLILKLAKLAYIHLVEDNVLFFKKDLDDCGINLHQDLEKSGMCKEVFVSESVTSFKDRIYCFVHLSIQEYLAALFVFYSFSTGNFEVLTQFALEGQQLHHLLKGVVEKSLKSQNGHLDLFLRFLFGISLESNQKVLQGLLTHTQNTSENLETTIQYVKDTLNRCSQFPERCMNLLLCLVEMKDQSLHTEAQRYIDRGDMLSPAICSTLAYMMLVSEQTQEVFDVSSYNTTDRGRERLVVAIRGCRLAQLVSCGLKEISCKTISCALQSENSPLKELNLSCNNLQDIGIQVLSQGLSHKNCKLETLRLASCNLTGSSCRILSLVLQSSESHLRELDLTNNNLAAEGVQELSPALSLPSCKLEKLILAACNLTGESCGALAAALQSGTSHLMHLDLTNNDLGEPGVDKLSTALGHYNCKLEILKLSGCLVSERACEVLASVLTSKSTCLKGLDLSYNHTEDSGVRLRSKLQAKGCHVKIDPNTEQWMKPGLQKYACELTLDINTAHPELKLSEDKRSVTKGEEDLDYPDRPQRFDVCPQLLCAQGLTGCHYWEADWSGPEVVIGVAYESLERKAHGAICKIGLNRMSYGLWCEGGQLSVRYNLNKTDVPVPTFDCSRIGLYLDWPAGTLSFYAVSSETLFHLHTFHCRVGDPPRPGFPEPLYPGFWLQYGSTVSLGQVT